MRCLVSEIEPADLALESLSEHSEQAIMTHWK